jgi:hypothetical protein
MNASVAGTYTKATALSSTNKVTIDVNVTAIGTYSITTTPTNGMTFSASGAFTTTGVQTVTLTGSGTPANSGAISIPVTAGTTSCNFTINVNDSGTTQPPPAGTYFWKFTSGGDQHQGTIDPGAQLQNTSVGGVSITVFGFSGNTGASDTSIVVTLGDISGGINTNETYSSTSVGTTNGVGIVINYGGVVFQADPQTSGANVTLKVTSHSTATKVIAGTFSGTLKAGTQTLTITNGQFSVNYQ